MPRMIQKAALLLHVLLGGLFINLLHIFVTELRVNASVFELASDLANGAEMAAPLS